VKAPDRCLITLRLLQHATHLDGCAGCTNLVVPVAEDQKKGVAAELQEVSGVQVGHLQHLAEDMAEHIGQFLSTNASPSSETLGETGETRYVDETEGGVELPIHLPLRVEVPTDGYRGDIAIETGRPLVNHDSASRDRTAIAVNCPPSMPPPEIDQSASVAFDSLQSPLTERSHQASTRLYLSPPNPPRSDRRPGRTYSPRVGVATVHPLR
jgi:hypothetical protein